jgi:D-alanyl-D-alanine dipeptidase
MLAAAGDLPPIPPLSEPPDWARLPIVECGEPLETLAETNRLRARAVYAESGIPGAPATISVRAGVAERVRRAAESLPAGIALVVFDGFRPLSVQKYLYDNYWAEVKNLHPNWTNEQIDLAVRQFVAAPVADPACPPPHRTGGALDVFLVDASTGEELAMGTAPDEVSPASATRWFEKHAQEPFTTHRRLLFHAMTGTGFTNYRGEWWHYDFGNQRWANITGADHAIYGAAPEESEDTLPCTSRP